MYDSSIEWEWISIRNEFKNEFTNLKKIRKKPLDIKIENRIKKEREILLNKLHLDDHEQTMEERILLSEKSEEDKLIIEDLDTINELTTFVAKRQSFEADDGHNDDLVMSLVLFSWLTRQ